MTPADDQKPSLLTQARSLCVCCALTGASLAAGSETSQAFVDFSRATNRRRGGLLARDSTSRPSGFPSSAPNLPSYADYLQRFRFRQMSIRQVIAPHANSHGSVHNSLPPRFMWRNIRSTLQVVDPLADRLDLPVNEVVSVYRTPAYNAAARAPRATPTTFATTRWMSFLNARQARSPPWLARCGRRACSKAAWAATEALPTSTPAEATRTGSRARCRLEAALGRLMSPAAVLPLGGKRKRLI